MYEYSTANGKECPPANERFLITSIWCIIALCYFLLLSASFYIVMLFFNYTMLTFIWLCCYLFLNEKMKEKPVELRLQTVNWARLQVTQGTQWGREISQSFQDRGGNLDNYGKHSFLEYLDFIENPYTYGTEYDIIMLCLSWLKFALLNIIIIEKYYLEKSYRHYKNV